MILDMLRNPIDAGDVAFRGTVHPGLHPAIISTSKRTKQTSSALLL